MKRTVIFAMLAAFALMATPLLTMNASAEIVEDPIVIDTTGADWDYRVYGDVIGGEWYGDVIGGEWYGAGWWGECNGYTYVITPNGGAYPSDAVDCFGQGPGHFTFSTSDTNPGSLHIILNDGEPNQFTFSTSDTNPGSLHIILTSVPDDMAMMLDGEDGQYMFQAMYVYTYHDCFPTGNTYMVIFASGDVIGGEWYGGGDEAPFGLTYLDCFPTRYTFINIEVTGTGNLYEEV